MVVSMFWDRLRDFDNLQEDPFRQGHGKRTVMITVAITIAVRMIPTAAPSPIPVITITSVYK